MDYDYDNFISQVKHLDKEDILTAAWKRHKSLDKSSSMPMKDRLAFQKGVGDLLYWLEKGERPEHITDMEFEKLRPVCESLIRKNQLDPSALDIFP